MPQMREIVIKPTLACTARCPTCASRRQLHAGLRNERKISLEMWREIFSEADSLGASQLTISGGEPTLYEHLPALIMEGKGYGWKVRVNSNGGSITGEYARALLDAGLDTMCISLYAASSEKMSAMRGNPLLWEKATEAISIFAGLEEDYPGFEIRSQTILSRDNYLDFPALIELHASLGSRNLILSYLEGDFEGDYLPGEAEIRRFRDEIIPQAIHSCGSLEPLVRLAARKNISRIFSPAILSIPRWASGEYWEREKPCHVPSTQSLILANGDVHPCNIVEYTHEPVAGNLFRQSLTEIWNGEIWGRFREGRHEKCRLCPINRHSSIPLRPGSRIGALYSLFFYNKALSQKTYPLVRLLEGIRRRKRLSILKENL